MQKIIFISIIVYLYSGCSKQLTLSTNNVENREFSCNQEAQPKSLQLLEQQYRCTSQK